VGDLVVVDADCVGLLGLGVCEGLHDCLTLLLVEQKRSIEPPVGGSSNALAYACLIRFTSSAVMMT
jgi:hypothetical protein